MASLSEIRKKIKIVTSTSKITNAMKLVASAKLKKNKNIFKNMEAYYQEFIATFLEVKKRADVNFLIKKREHANKTLWICFFSSVGLCGGFNLNLVKKLKELIETNDEIYIIGKKGLSLVKSKEILNEVVLDIEIDDRDINHDLFQIFGNNLLDAYFDNTNIKGINILYTKFINSLSFIPTVFSLLPFDPIINKIEPKPMEGFKKYNLSTSEPTELLKAMLTNYFSICLYGSILESKVCENSSRRNAMDSATKNADEILNNYHLEFNRRRQDKITQEITEIVSGANIGD